MHNHYYSHNCSIRCLLFCSLAIMLAVSGSQAQWLQSRGPKGGPISSIAASNSTLFAATYMVELCVHDLRGKKVTTLIKGELSPGTHRVSFPAAGLARGSYLLKLRIGATSHTRRILPE